MKLRIKGNSMRFRVSRSEVARLLAADPLVETIQFAPEAGAMFTYALQREHCQRHQPSSLRSRRQNPFNPVGAIDAFANPNADTQC